MALGADDVQAAGLHHPLVLGVRLRPGLGEGRLVDLRRRLRRVDALGVQGADARPAGLPPSRMSVPRPAMFVAMVTAPMRPAWATIGASFSWNLAFRTSCLMPAPLEHLGEDLALLDADRADQDRPARLRHLHDLVDDGVELGVLVAEDQVRVVVPDHRAVGGDRDHVKAVDLVELLLLGHGRAGHAGQLVVQAEVVLEGDRGQGHRLALDAQALLGLDRLVEAPPTSAGRASGGR